MKIKNKINIRNSFLIVMSLIYIVIFTQVLRAEILEIDKTIGENTFPAGTEVHCYDSGQLKKVGLIAEQEIQGIRCPQDTTIYFWKSGKIQQVTLNSHETQEVQDIKWPEGTDLYFYESGKIRNARLPKDYVVQGTKCAGATTVQFWETGQLKNVRLSEDQEIQGIICSKATPLYFYESGKLLVARLTKDQEIKGEKYHKGDVLKLDEEGNAEILTNP